MSLSTVRIRGTLLAALSQAGIAGDGAAAGAGPTPGNGLRNTPEAPKRPGSRGLPASGSAGRTSFGASVIRDSPGFGPSSSALNPSSAPTTQSALWMDG